MWFRAKTGLLVGSPVGGIEARWLYPKSPSLALLISEAGGGEGFFEAVGILGDVDADGGFVGFADGDGFAVFEGAELFEFLDHLDAAGGEFAEVLEELGLVGIHAEVEAGVGVEEGLIGHAFEVAREGDGARLK